MLLNRVYIFFVFAVLLNYIVIYHTQSKKKMNVGRRLSIKRHPKNREGEGGQSVKQLKREKNMPNFSSNSQMDFFSCASFSISFCDTPHYSPPILVWHSSNDVSIYVVSLPLIH